MGRAVFTPYFSQDMGAIFGTATPVNGVNRGTYSLYTEGSVLNNGWIRINLNGVEIYSHRIVNGLTTQRGNVVVTTDNSSFLIRMDKDDGNAPGWMAAAIDKWVDWVQINGTWRQVVCRWVLIDGTWRQVGYGWNQIDGTWRPLV